MITDEQLKLKTSPLNFRYKVKEEENQEYIEMLENLLESKRTGDWETVALMTGIETANARMAFMRVYSKYHIAVVDALKKVITTRNEMIKKQINN